MFYSWCNYPRWLPNEVCNFDVGFASCSGLFTQPNAKKSKRLKGFMIEDILEDNDEQPQSSFSSVEKAFRVGAFLIVPQHRNPIYPLPFKYDVPQSTTACLSTSSTQPKSTETDNVPSYLRTILRESRKRRRNRTVFSRLQMQQMEDRFLHKKYLSTRDRNDFAKLLRLTPLQVKTWYQNRRMKWKKEMLRIDPTVVTTRAKGRPRKDEF